MRPLLAIVLFLASCAAATMSVIPFEVDGYQLNALTIENIGEMTDKQIQKQAVGVMQDYCEKKQPLVIASFVTKNQAGETCIVAVFSCVEIDSEAER